MPRLSSTEQLEAYRRQQVEIAKKIKEAEARGREKRRQDELRRESLAGRIVLDHLAGHPGSATAKAMLALLDAELKRPADRALFPALLAPPAAAIGAETV